MKKKGVVYLIGAGPGDPGLFTLKGQRILLVPACPPSM
jgi:uroporphyrinogen III methyltransferase/synthase